MATAEQGRIRLHLINATNAERTLTIEPWGTEYSLEPGMVYDIVAEGDIRRPIRLELAADGLTVGALDSEGATLRVLKAGYDAPIKS